MAYDENSFLQGIVVGRAMRGYSVLTVGSSLNLISLVSTAGGAGYATLTAVYDRAGNTPVTCNMMTDWGTGVITYMWPNGYVLVLTPSVPIYSQE